MRLGLALVVVPNASLLDNHQDELAEELELQGYATRSDIRLATLLFIFHNTGFDLSCSGHSLTFYRGLARAIGNACEKQEKAWVGHNTSLAPIIDAVVGYEDDVRARLD
jgi:beta-1,4-N-acetylglucosaminyltransferase